MYCSNNSVNERRVSFKWLVYVSIWFLLSTGFAVNGIATPIRMASFSGQMAHSSEEIIDLSSRKGAELFINVNEQFRRQDYTGIKTSAMEQIARDNRLDLAHEILGSALFMMGQEEDAIAEFKTAILLDPRQSGSYTKLGIIQMENGKIDEALTNLKSAIKYNPKNRSAHQHLGLIYEYKKDFPRAIKHFKKGLEGSSPFYLGISVNLGQLLNKENRYKETVDILSPRLPMGSELFEAHMILASALFGTHQFDPAQSRFERALELNPKSPEARLGICMCLRMAGHADIALSQIESLTKENPDWLPGLIEYGETLLALNHPQKARETFEKSIRLGNNPATVKKRVARYHLRQKEFNAAEEIFLQLIRSGDADVEVYAQMSELFQAKGMHDKGISLLEKGLQRYPDNGYLLFRLGVYLASIKQYDKAVIELKRALHTAPNDPTVLNSLSITQAKAGETKGSLNSAAQLYKLQPNNTKAGILYATRLQANGKIKNAEEIYRKILVSDPENAIALNNLADLLADNGNLKEAEGLARKLNASTGGNNAMFLDTLGWILYRQNRFADASHFLEKAKNTNANIPTVYFHLGMTLAASGDMEKARQVLRYAIDIGDDAQWVPDAQKKLEGI